MHHTVSHLSEPCRLNNCSKTLRNIFTEEVCWVALSVCSAGITSYFLLIYLLKYHRRNLVWYVILNAVLNCLLHTKLLKRAKLERLAVIADGTVKKNYTALSVIVQSCVVELVLKYPALQFRSSLSHFSLEFAFIHHCPVLHLQSPHIISVVIKADISILLFHGVQVRGLPGTFIVNQHRPGALPPQTLITFNRGGFWSPIAAPKLHANGQPTNCHLVTLLPI